MREVEEHNISVTIHKNADLAKRIEVLTLLFRKAETKVNHADNYRQRNMNYSLVIFAGLIGLGVNLSQYPAKVMISSTLLILMIIFCVWDRRWHRIKHGWQGTAKDTYIKICEMISDPKRDMTVILYKSKSEENTEFFSWQPIVYYFLVIGAALSFWLFYLTKNQII